MLIKTKQTWKDLVENSDHKTGWSRRDFLTRGLATGMLTVTMPQYVADEFLNKANAAMPANCPAPVRNTGAIAQIFAEGGPTMGARFISDMQAAVMNATMAANYGISGQANLVKLGPNLNIDSTSPWGMTLLQGPNGYPGGAAAWKTNVLSKLSAGGHLGPFNADDGAGVNSGLIGGVSPFKTSVMGKDIRVNISNTVAQFANGLPSVGVSGNNLQPSSLANLFSLTPAATGLTSSAAMSAASDAANALAQAFANLMGTNVRKGSAALQTSAGCAFYGNAALADPNYGANLFNPNNITALTGNVTVTALSNQEQALLAAYYQAAAGVAGGVILELNGRDYHGQSPQNSIAPADIEEARALVMFLAACDAAQAKGSFLYFANGQAIANGVQNVTATIGGNNVNVNAPVAQGDAGGSYNAGLAIFYDPKGAPPAAKFTGTINSSNGNASVDPNVSSAQNAVAGLYLSALSWINGGTIPPAAISAISATGASTSSSVMVI